MSSRGGAKTSMTSVSSGKYASWGVLPGMTAVARAAHPLLAVEVELHPARDHPEDLLVRMLVARGVRPRLHLPEDDHALVAYQDAAADLVADLLLGELLEVDVTVHHGDRHGGASS
jgi:hypothetical protein